MPYTIHWYNEGSEVIFKGKVTADQIREADNAHYGNERFDAIHYVLYDFSQCSIAQVNLSDTEEYAAYDAACRFYKETLKVAFVSPDKAAQKIFNHYINSFKLIHSNWKFSIFNNYDEAKQWCKQA